jgi:hypothetical protein
LKVIALQAQSDAEAQGCLLLRSALFLTFLMAATQIYAVLCHSLISAALQ